MTVIENAGKFSFDELCKALAYDNENDFTFIPVNNDRVINVLFNDYFPVRKNTPPSKIEDKLTTIKVTEDNIEIRLGESITGNDTKKIKLFSAIESVLADYIFAALIGYYEKANNKFAREHVKNTYAI
jgi:hypothetical protein